MLKLISIALTGSLLASGALAQRTDYDQCREVVAMHSFMMEARKVCRLKLREDTSNHAYGCVSTLSEGHREIAIRHGRDVVWKSFRQTNGGRTCAMVKDNFAPLIAD